MTVSYDSAQRRRSLSFVTHVAPAILYAGAIFYGGLIRMAALPEVGFVATDKLMHAAAFAGLAFLLMRAARFCMPASSLPKQLLVGALGASALGALLEICQAFVPYRSADVWDWAADTVGAALAVGVLLAWWRLLPRRADG
ncbi:MAG TPA: VanZ family protein [Polyangiaceae bacterium]|nr:VanZ family protein [Polyangiaceae bacterium]